MHDLGRWVIDTACQQLAEWQQAGTLVAQLRLQRSTQLHALGLLVGQPDLALPPSPQPLAELLPLAPLAPGLPAQLLENRPDILAAEHQLQAANARIGAARAMYFPRIALTALGGTASAELDGLFTAGSRAWTFAPSIALPLFDGGRRKANVQLSEVQREQAVNHYQRTIEAAFRDVADALAATQWLDTQLHSLQATDAFLADDHVSSHLFRRCLFFVQQREIFVMQQATATNCHQFSVFLIPRGDQVVHCVIDQGVQCFEAVGSGD